MFRSYLKNFSEKCTIHGVAYIGNSRSHIVEKIFWIISLVISLIFTGLWIGALVAKQARTPIVVAVDDTPIDVSEINFPSMTVCPGIATWVNLTNYELYIPRIKEGEMDLSNFTDLDLEYLQIIGLTRKDDFLSKFNISISTENFKARLLDFPHFFGKIERNGYSGTLDRGNFSEKWHFNYTEVLGPSGFCYSFNFPKTKSFKKFDLSSDFNYNRTIVTSTQNGFTNFLEHDDPLKTSEASLGIIAHLVMERKNYIAGPIENVFVLRRLITKNIEDGYQLTFHDPFEIISKDSANFYANFNRTSLFLITPRLMDYDDSIEVFSSEQRNCFLPEEKTLKYFKVYNKINCEHECLANSTLETCECVQFFMVRGQFTRICGVLDSNCFNEVDRNFSLKRSKCNCLDPCRRVKYEIEMRVVGYHKKTFEGASIESRFTDDGYYQHILKRPYSVVDMLAFTGGLLGLFAGLSAMSVIEVIYFFSLRLIFELRAPKVHPAQTSHESSAKSFFKNMIKNTSVHGFFYIVSESRKIQKLFWILAFALSIYGFALMTRPSFKKYSLKAASITQDSRSLSISEIPFPAITFSGPFENSYSQLYGISYGILRYYFSFSTLQRQLDTLRTRVEMFICETEPYFEYEDIRFNYSKNSDFVGVLMYITNKSQKRWFNDRNASWRNDPNPSYVETLTLNGIAFTFNTLTAHEMFNMNTISEDFTLIESNKSFKSTTQIPWKSSLSLNNEFKISFSAHSYLRLRPGKNFVCKNAAFLLHSPYEMQMNVPYERFSKLLFGTSIEILIKPEIIKSDDNIREMDLEDRKCYFHDEYLLKYFKRYTKSHCDLEVLSDLTFKECGCVPFNYIRNKSMAICDISQWICVIYQQHKVVRGGKKNTIYSRHCLPLCDSISYDFEIITNRVATNFSDNSLNEVTLSFKFKDKEVVQLKRYRQFPAINFLSTIGGFLGLFAGVSFLSILETFYVLIVRPITNLIKSLTKKICQKT